MHKAITYFFANPRDTILYGFGRLRQLLLRATGCDLRDIDAALEEFALQQQFREAVESRFHEARKRQFDWNQDHAFLYALARLIRPRMIVETGVFDGGFSACFLQALLVNTELDSVECGLVSIDLPAHGAFAESTDRMTATTLPCGKGPGWLIPDDLRQRWKLHLGDSRELLPGVIREAGEVDLFFHDSLHTFDHMSFEYQTAWPSLKERGILLSHDVHWNRAFPDFARAHRHPYCSAHGFGAIRKVAC